MTTGVNNSKDTNNFLNMTNVIPSLICIFLIQCVQ